MRSLGRTALLGVLALISSAPPLLAMSAGIMGYSGKQRVICTACHDGGDVPRVDLSGPTSLDAGATGDFVFTVHSGNLGKQIAAGFNVAASDGALKTSPGQKEHLDGSELTHTSPKDNDDTGTAAWKFKWQAPTTPGNYILWGAGNSVNLNFATSGDNAAGTMLFVAVGGVATVTQTITTTPSVTRTPSSTPTSTLAAPTSTPTDVPSPTRTATATSSSTCAAGS